MSMARRSEMSSTRRGGVRGRGRPVRQAERMSPTSRSRKRRNKKSTLRSATPRLLDIQDDMPEVEVECDCPGCSGEDDIDLQQLTDEMVDVLAESEDPLMAETVAAQLVAMGQVADQEFDEAQEFDEGLIG